MRDDRRDHVWPRFVLHGLLMASLLGSCSTTHTRSGSAQGSAEPRQRGALERTLTAIPRTIVAVPEGILSIPGQFMAMRERANAFISYSAPPRKSTELRLAVKDLIDMKGKVTSAGSEYVAKNSAPAAQDAPCLQLARERNVRIVGKTNLTELAVTASGRNRYFGTPISRLDGFHENIAGGSSSGSAVAVKTGMADVAFGTDTAGSIRTPAACCGVYGLKTTFGLVPTKGVFPISPDHLDTVGPLAKDLPHLVQGMDLLQRGFAEQYQKAVAAKPSGAQLRIGRLYLDGTDPAINKAIDDALAAAGCRVVKLGDDFKAKWVQAQKYGKTVALGDIWRHDKEYVNKQGVRKTTKGVILLGELEEKNYAAAVAAKAGWQSALRQVFEQVDFIALPTLQKLPPHPPVFSVPAVFEWQVFNVQNTLPANYAGNPALAMPVAMPAKAFTVPVTSLQLIGPPNSEAGLLNAARLIGRPIPDPAFNSGMKAMGSAMFGWMDDEPSRTEATR